MKKHTFTAILLALIIPLCGCLNAIPELSEEEETQIVRYMADCVIKNDVSYKARLLDDESKSKAIEEEIEKARVLEEIKKEEEEKKQKSKEDNTPVTVDVVEEPNVYTMADINDYLGLEGVEFEYSGYKTYESYPEDNDELGFVITPAQNNVLLVLTLNIYNSSGQDISVDLFNKAVYKILINSNKKITSIKSLFENDLNSFSDVISKETGKSVVLIFEVPSDISLDNISLSVGNNSEKPIYIDLN